MARNALRGLTRDQGIKLAEALYLDPVVYCKEVLHFQPTYQQEAVLNDLRAWVLLNRNKPFREQKPKRISIKSGHGCFGKGTMVLTAEGASVPVEDVKVGMYLLGDDSTPRTVLELKRGQENLYRFTYRDGTGHVFNESHILCLVATQSHGKQKTGDVVFPTVREYLGWSDRKKRTHAAYRAAASFPEKALEIPPYILGVWLGDGSSSSPDVTTADPEIVSALQEYADRLGMRVTRYSKYTYGINGGWSSGSYLRNGLSFYGLKHHKHIPSAYQASSRVQRLELLAGLLDTDGSLDARTRRQFEITQKSEELAHQIVFLCRSLGFRASATPVEKFCFYKREKKVGRYFRICISGAVEDIPVRIARKRADQKPRQKDELRTGILSVEPLGLGDYYGFVLDGNHRFLDESFMVLHNTGKTRFLAAIMHWWETTRYDGLTVCTAPKASQLEDVLWREFTKIHEKAQPPFNEHFDILSDEIRHKAAPKTQKALARTARKENPEALQGFHDPNLLVICEEASGIPEEIFEVGEGALSTPGCLVILAGNPTRVEGTFYRSFHQDRALWDTFHFNREELECRGYDFVDPGYSQRMAAKYGRDSNVYRVRVLGEFPTADPDTLIPLWQVEAAVGRDLRPLDDDPQVVGVDVARFGDDESVALFKHGPRIMSMKVWRQLDTMQVASRVHMEARLKKPKPTLFVDSIGVGGGVADRLRDLGWDALDVNVSERPSEKEDFRALRDELWWRVREDFEAGKISIAEDVARLPGESESELVDQLASIKYKFNDNKLKVESKDERKRRGLCSPDRADALMMTYAKPMLGLKTGWMARAKMALTPRWAVDA